MPTPADVRTISSREPTTGMADRPRRSATVIHSSRITRTQQGEPGLQTPLDLRCVRHQITTGFRLGGSVNGKTGRLARILEADFQLAPYPIEQLVGDLPDPTSPRTARRAGRNAEHRDPYKRISPPEYFKQLAGIEVPRDGLVSCPARGHPDKYPSCSVGVSPDQGWCCHSGNCGARGAIYDLASVLLGGPWGRELRGEQFKRARAYVADVFGELT
jgi:hypothetical protein